MRERMSARLLVLLFAFSLLAAACGGGGGEGATSEDAGDTDATETGEETTEGEGEDAAAGGDGVLVYGTTEKPGGIDPAEVYEKFASDILFNTTNRLVEFPPGGDEVGPGLAESWEISDDGLTYTFTLREGVTFHDGSEMTSEDVKWSLERALNISHPDGAAFLLSGIESVEAPDPQTVVITLSEPNITFLARLNYTVASILPSDAGAYTAPDVKLELGSDAEAAQENLRQEANSFLNNETIIGTGPYQLTEYQPGTSMTLEAFDGYWGDAPAIDTVRVQFFEDSAQMRNALAAGEIDLVLNGFGPAEATSLEGEEGITVTEGAGGRTRYIVLDVTQEPFTDPKVRQAVATTIDRQRIIDEVFEGKGNPLFSMIPSSFEVSEDFISDLSAELEQPVEFELWYPLNKYGDTEADVAETIARSLNESGNFNVTTQSSDWASEFSNNLNTGAYKAYLLGWYPDYLDPDDYIEPFYDSVDTFIGFYSNPRMDELISAEQQETDPEARAEIFTEIQQLAAEDMPFIPLYEEGTTIFSRDNIQGVEDTLDASQQLRFFVLSKS